MIGYSQFCPVAKAAEVFGDRWTPLIMRELCFGTRSFGELLAAAPLISRTVLAQRLRQLEQDGVVYIEAKPKGKGHLYRLTPAGEDFRPIVELMSVWGQRWAQGLIGPDDLDPKMLLWGCDGRSVRLRSPCKALSFVSISAGSQNPIAAHGTGGWFCAPTILRFASRLLPAEMSISSSPLIWEASQRCGLAIAD
jgi:DNA-binding HxlR family transcriptional regulator